MNAALLGNEDFPSAIDEISGFVMTSQFAANQRALHDFVTDDAHSQVLSSAHRQFVDTRVHSIVLRCTTKLLRFSAVVDDDTLDAECAAIGEFDPTDFTDISAEPPWNGLLGLEIDVGWVAENQQGYCDSVLLSGGFFVPRVLLYVIASSIEVLLVEGKA